MTSAVRQPKRSATTPPSAAPSANITDQAMAPRALAAARCRPGTTWGKAAPRAGSKKAEATICSAVRT